MFGIAVKYLTIFGVCLNFSLFAMDPEESKKDSPRLLVFLGSPGAGKGTLSQGLKKDLNYKHLSTGDLLRESLEKGSDLGLKYKKEIESGEYLPSEAINEIIKEELSNRLAERSTLVLDGFPRTVEQGIFFDKALQELGIKESTLFIIFSVDPDVAIKRIVQRASCGGCGHIYNFEYAPPTIKEVCDKCSMELKKRKCDNYDDAKRRIEIFEKNFEDLHAFYKGSRPIIYIDANSSAVAVYDDFLKNLSRY